MRFPALPLLLLSPLLPAADQDRDLGSVADPGHTALRVVAIGDFGYRGEGSGQEAVAASIRRLHGELPFHLGLTLGDNFYPDGVTSVKDPHWSGIWEPGYGPMRIPFFASLGNHDYHGKVQAQIDYSGLSSTWRMPHRYYTFSAGPAQFFALDTDEGTAGRLLFAKPWSDAQARWLDAALTRSQAPWKIVYGHHPIYSDGHHGDEKRLQKKLLPILNKHGVAAYLCGHEHDLQHHVQGGIDFFVAGGGGRQTRAVEKRRAVFAAGRHGFLEIQATQRTLVFRLRAANGAVVHAQQRAR